MASSNNLASLEPWSFRPSSFPDSWISDAFSHDTDALTKALQQSLYSNNNPLTELYGNHNSPFQQQMIKPEALPTPTGSASVVSDITDIFPKRRAAGLVNGKITKRKSRASKRSPTTYIVADPANFRRMVQQVTGIQFGELEMPVTSSVSKPEPHRPGNRIQNCILPTLDTSECWLGREGPLDAGNKNGAVDGGSGLEYESFHSFPTLESWQ